MGKILLRLVAGVVTAGCVPTYSEVAKTVPASMLEFEKGYEVGAGFARSSLQEYWFVDDRACGNPQRAAWFTWANDPKESRRVLAARQVNIVARTKFYEGAGGTITAQPGARVNVSGCLSLAQFTPEVGRVYNVVHKTTPEGKCDLVVLDTETSSPPRDLIVRQPAPCSEEAIP